jgi:hypothetical protein
MRLGEWTVPVQKQVGTGEDNNNNNKLINL